MNDEIKRILKLLEEGKINSDQASELIDAIKEDKAVTHRNSTYRLKR